MSALGKILSVEALPNRTVRLVWDDGATATIDLDELIGARRPLAPLADEAEFNGVKVSADGWSLEWPSGIDFGTSQLRRWAKLDLDEKIGA
jgi:Protein of unknown function (DUF2442)